MGYSADVLVIDVGVEPDGSFRYEMTQYASADERKNLYVTWARTKRPNYTAIGGDAAYLTEEAHPQVIYRGPVTLEFTSPDKCSFGQPAKPGGFIGILLLPIGYTVVECFPDPVAAKAFANGTRIAVFWQVVPERNRDLEREPQELRFGWRIQPFIGPVQEQVMVLNRKPLAVPEPRAEAPVLDVSHLNADFEQRSDSRYFALCVILAAPVIAAASIALVVWASMVTGASGFVTSFAIATIVMVEVITVFALLREREKITEKTLVRIVEKTISAEAKWSAAEMQGRSLLRQQVA